MQKHQYVGKTLDDALEQAASDLGTERENLSYNILPAEPGRGLIKKLFSKSIQVEAWIENTEDLQEAARKAVQEAIDGKPEKGGGRNRNKRGSRKGGRGNREASAGANGKPQTEQKERERRPRRNRQEENPNAITFDAEGAIPLLEEYTEWFLKVFGSTTADATFTRTEEGDMRVDVKNELLEDLLGRSDRLSGSFEHVFKRIVQKKIGDLPQRLYLDSGSASEKRMESLREMAQSMAEKVKRTGRSITVNSKSGQERRMIHVTIDEIEGVATRSVGSGDGRKLVIFSTEKRRRRRGPRRKDGPAKQGEHEARGEATQNPEELEESAAFSDNANFDTEGAEPLQGSDDVSKKQSTPKPKRARRPRNRKPRGEKAAAEAAPEEERTASGDTAEHSDAREARSEAETID